MPKILRATVLSLMLILFLAGCSGGDGTDQADDASKTGAAEQADTEHPTSDSQTSEHPTSEHPQGDQPDSTQAEADHPN